MLGSEQQDAPAPPAWIAAAEARRAGPGRHITPELAMSLTTVYRAVQIHVTSAIQLPIDVYRGDETIPTPALIDRPCLDMDRLTFIDQTVQALYLDGSAFWRRVPDPTRPGLVAELLPLPPGEVEVQLKRRDNGRDERRYSFRGRKYTPAEIVQLDLMRLPGAARGLGPIGAARATVAGALDARDYGASWLDTSSVPDGVLTTEQALSAAEARQYREAWYGRRPDGSSDPDRRPGERLRVLGQGLSYQHLALKPADVQFLETQQFTALELARLFGVSADLLDVPVEGGSRTYSNVEQGWAEYARFGLMLALARIEQALTDCLPRGQRARFRIDALARADRKTRIEGHKMLLDAGIATVPEVRAWEGLPPLKEHAPA